MLNGREHFYPAWLELVKQAAADPPLLDVGTPAPFHKELAPVERFAARPVYCLDVIPGRRVDLLGDAHRLPFASGSFGGVLCSHVLEHVADPALVVREVKRVLVGGGAAYFTLLDFWPYHASPGVYADYHRFKQDAVDLLFGDWADVTVVEGGGIGQVIANYTPIRVKDRIQPAVNLLDRYLEVTMTPVRYVLARA